MAESQMLLRWRKEQPRGAIMKPESFKKIEQGFEAGGLSKESAEKVAGRAYWDTAKFKHRKTLLRRQ